MPTNLQIAETILKQLGGNKFLAMTGARDLTAYEQGLRFRLPRNSGASHGIQYVTISLAPNDTYTVIFSSLNRQIVHKIIATDTGVYADNLRAIFTARTGLKVSL